MGVTDLEMTPFSLVSLGFLEESFDHGMLDIVGDDRTEQDRQMPPSDKTIEFGYNYALLSRRDYAAARDVRRLHIVSNVVIGTWPGDHNLYGRICS